jgi:hypothetical protein
MTEPLATVPKGDSDFRVVQDGSFDGTVPDSSIKCCLAIPARLLQGELILGGAYPLASCLLACS